MRPRSCRHQPARQPHPVVPLLLAAVLFSASQIVLADDEPPAWVVDARQRAQALGGQLKQALTGAIEQDGLVAAVEVCQIQAPTIADGVSTESMRVGRTALRVRNPANAADAWERRILEDFEHQMASGKDPAGLEVIAIRHVDGQRQGHWMSAIPTGGMCLSCHGSSLDPELQQTIDERYPQDRATGFEPGSLRGAFRVRFDLPDSD